MPETTGNFGRLVDDYELGRKEYSPKLMKHVRNLIGNKPGTMILDLGCGTGKSTRRLSSKTRFVIGADPDTACIHRALNKPGENLSYCLAHAEKLPFSRYWFDAVTTFCSFHWWFHLPGVMDEIDRVLMDDGKFIIVDQNDMSPFRDHVVGIVNCFRDKPIPKAKKNYDPKKLLESDGRWTVTETHWEHTDTFTKMELQAQIRSMAPWSAVAEHRQEEAMKSMMHVFWDAYGATKDYYARPLRIRVVCARKK